MRTVLLARNLKRTTPSSDNPHMSKPTFSKGEVQVSAEWSRVAVASDEMEAGLMRVLLEEAEIPVLVEGDGIGDAGFSNGPRSVLAPDDKWKEARQILEDTTGVG